MESTSNLLDFSYKYLSSPKCKSILLWFLSGNSQWLPVTKSKNHCLFSNSSKVDPNFVCRIPQLLPRLCPAWWQLQFPEIKILTQIFLVTLVNNSKKIYMGKSRAPVWEFDQSMDPGIPSRFLPISTEIKWYQIQIQGSTTASRELQFPLLENHWVPKSGHTPHFGSSWQICL